MAAWDDELGHATIWKYDAEDHLTAWAVIVHWRDKRPSGIAGEAIWYDPSGHETRRSPLRVGDEGSIGE